MRRFDLVAERVDVDTEKSTCQWQDNTLRFPYGMGTTPSQVVGLVLWRTKMEYRVLLGPRLVAALSTESPLRKLAMKLGRSTAVDEAGDPWISNLPPACSLDRCQRGGVHGQVLPREESVVQHCPDDQAKRCHREWRPRKTSTTNSGRGSRPSTKVSEKSCQGVLLAKRWAYGY